MGYLIFFFIFNQEKRRKLKVKDIDVFVKNMEKTRKYRNEKSIFFTLCNSETRKTFK